MKESTARRILRTIRDLTEELDALRKTKIPESKSTEWNDKTASIQKTIDKLLPQQEEARATMDRYNEIQAAHEAAVQEVKAKVIEAKVDEQLNRKADEIARELVNQSRQKMLERNRQKDPVALGKAVPMSNYESMGNKAHKYSEATGADKGAPVAGEAVAHPVSS